MRGARRARFHRARLRARARLFARSSVRSRQLNDDTAYNRTPLHVAVTTGDPDMVALLLEFGADRNAPATFWNCCCCKKTPTQFVDMRTGERELPVEQRASIKELLMR